MAINLASISYFLQPGIDGIKVRYPQLPREWQSLYDMRTSEKQVEFNVIAAGLSVAAVKEDGEPLILDNRPGQRYKFSQSHLEASTGFSITKQAIEDNLYKNQFSKDSIGLRDAFYRFEQIWSADPFNTAQTYNTAIGGDGVALCSTAHPVDGSTFSNIASPAVSLNEAALNAGQTAINNGFRDPRNNRMDAKPRKLLVGPQLEAVAKRLIKTELQTNTGNNNVSTVQLVQGGLPDGCTVWNYLTNAFAWFIMTDQKGMVHYKRTEFEPDMTTDFLTKSLLVSGRMRKSWGYDDPRGIYGSFATA